MTNTAHPYPISIQQPTLFQYPTPDQTITLWYPTPRNTSAEIRVHPDVLNKAHHDTYLRQGELRAASAGCADVYDSLEAAAQELESKLKAWAKAPPRKMNPKHSSQLRQHGSTQRGRV